MKLYFSPGACSLTPHIVLCEAGLKYELERVSIPEKKIVSGGDFREINPKGYVPALQLDNGEVLTEVSAIIQYLADQVPEKKLAPAAGTMEYYRLIEWLNFISTELHKSFTPLFMPGTPEETKQTVLNILALRIEIVEKQLKNSEYLSGNQFSIADAYLFTVLGWAQYVKLDLGRWPAVQAYLQRIAARPAVRAAMTEEGLIK